MSGNLKGAGVSGLCGVRFSPPLGEEWKLRWEWSSSLGMGRWFGSKYHFFIFLFFYYDDGNAMDSPVGFQLLSSFVEEKVVLVDFAVHISRHFITHIQRVVI